jgi:hypothetical protein
MKNLIKIAVALSLVLSSCALFGNQNEVRLSEVRDTASKIIDRHDVYVNADRALTVSSRDQFLQESHALLVLVGGETTLQETLKTAASPVCVRHDAYVNADTTLQPTQKSVYLDSTKILLRVTE